MILGLLYLNVELQNAIWLELLLAIIIAKAIKGKGVSFMENEVSWHGKAPNEEEYEKALKELEG